MNTGISMLVIFFTTILIFLIMVYRKITQMVGLIKENKRTLYIFLDWRSQLIHALNEVAHNINIKTALLDEIDSLYQEALTARKQRQSKEFMRIENSISNKIADIELLFEEHPKLKVNKDALELKENILTTQNDLELTQQAYNFSLEAYNKTKNAFFDSMMILLFPNNLKINLPYWKMDTKK